MLTITNYDQLSEKQRKQVDILIEIYELDYQVTIDNKTARLWGNSVLVDVPHHKIDNIVYSTYIGEISQ